MTFDHTFAARYHEPEMLRAAYHTLGCKVNQYETEQIRLAMEQAGFSTVPFASRADVYVINTCTVTAVADAKSRAAVRRAIRANPASCVIVTGCLAELEPQRIAAIEGVDLAIPNHEKHSIPQRALGVIFNKQSLRKTPNVLQSSDSPNLETSERLRLRTRAVVKVQDGCDHFCAYCVVPYARPVMQSRPLADVAAELKELAECGYKEVVLAGIRLGAYGAEKSNEFNLADLIHTAARVEGIERIRLSSIEPWEVDDALLDAMQLPKVCRHLHIPLQSGDDRILEAMGRPYTSSSYARLLERVRNRIKGIGITTDVVVGFPGETQKAFENTKRLVRDVAFSRLHVFRYSPRPRTRAAAMPDQINSAVKKARSEELTALGKQLARNFAESFIGQTLPVLVERKASQRVLQSDTALSGRTDRIQRLMGYADNYIETIVEADRACISEIVLTKIAGADQDGRALGTADCRRETLRRTTEAAR